jgi:BirA family biotin operon repressor/biotin-[acetyl-CoA-carboxylase] ligase
MQRPWWESAPQKHIYQWPVLHSTHQEALSWVDTYSIKESLWVWLRAHRQTQGVGQFSRPFISSLGGLYGTLVCCWPTPQLFPLLSLVVGLSIIDVLPCACRLKWVNDIYIDKQKIAGVLITRLVIKDKTIYLISFGLNVNSRMEGVVGNRSVTSIQQHLGYSLDLERLWDQIEASLYRRLLGALSADKIELLQDLNRVLMYKDQEVYVRTHHKWFHGVFGGISPSGQFVLDGQEIESILSIGKTPSDMAY